MLENAVKKRFYLNFLLLFGIISRFVPKFWLAVYLICKWEGLETSPPDSNISHAPATSLRSNP